MKKVALTTLGCDKNRCDSEQLAGTLCDQGFTFVARDRDADIIIVNTCAFIESARKEAIRAIKSKLKYRPRARVIVTGCITVRHRELIPAGVDEVWDLKDFGNARKLLSTPKSHVYIKIADGCDNWCSYCTIPAIRGRYRSRSAQDIVAEVKQFAGLGVPEFILVAQDLTKYPDLVGLIRQISKVDGVHRIRLHYVYPSGVTDDLIEEIAGNPKVCKYLDIPFQHVSERVLGAMNRKQESADTVVEKLRARIPDITIRSTFMVGFPTESDDEFKELLQFIGRAKLDYVGFFAYSREAGTRAFDMPQVSLKIKNFRLSVARSLQNDILMQKNCAMVGKTLKVVCDFGSDVLGYNVARTEGQSPDVDACVIVHDGVLVSGEFYDVKITGWQNENLIGEIV